jgi:molybdopterin/thiamine biosynthesis adenylyltransferase
MTLDFARQYRLVDFSKLSVSLIGCGGLGSKIAIELGKSGLNTLDLFDSDKIEQHNIPNSAFEPGDVGMYKTNVLCDQISEYGVHVSTYPHFDGEKMHKVVISAVDSIETRKDIFEHVLNQREYVDFYIDSRMGGEVGNIFVIDPCNFEQASWYQDNWLFEENEVQQLRCGEQTTSYTTSIVAGIVVANLNSLTKEEQSFTGLIIDLKNMAIQKLNP